MLKVCEGKERHKKSVPDMVLKLVLVLCVWIRKGQKEMLDNTDLSARNQALGAPVVYFSNTRLKVISPSEPERSRAAAAGSEP
jgi:hypothetical protein